MTGASRLIGDVFTNKIQITKIDAPTESNGALYGPGDSGQILKSNGTSVYWANDNNNTYTLAGLMGSTAIGKASLPVYWDGDAFKPITSYEGNAATATKLGASTVGSAKQPIYLNDGTPTATTYHLQADIRYQTHNATTSGWKNMLGRQSNPTLSVTRHQGTVPTWIPQSYSSSLVFGGGDTKGLLSCGYSSPVITIGGASTDGSTDDAPAWYFKLSGTSGTTYTFPTASKTLAATDGTGATGTWNISISGSAAKLGTSTVGGINTRPIYLNEGTPQAMNNISIVAAGTPQKYIEVGNDNGSVRLFASSNRGLYDSTNSKWIVYTVKEANHTYIPLWRSKGDSTQPVYFNSSGEPVACTSYANASVNYANSATKDGSGNVITSTYLKKSGDTMTGNLTLNKITGSSANYGDTLPATGTEGQIFFKTGSVETKIDTFYPVGSIYMSVNSANPGSLFGGTWEQIQNCFLLAAGSNYAGGSTGGEATHTLTTDEMPRHIHSYLGDYTSGGGTVQGEAWAFQMTKGGDSVGSWAFGTDSGATGFGYTGNSQPHNNMPPYLAVYVWKRTA